MIKHKPRRDPKFHQDDKFLGAGKFTIEADKILIIGLFLCSGLNIIKRA